MHTTFIVVYFYTTFWNSLNSIDHNFGTKSPINLKKKKCPTANTKKI